MSKIDFVTELHFVCTALPGPKDECVFVELENQNGAGIGGVDYPEIDWKNLKDGYATLVVPYVSPSRYAVMKALLEKYQYSFKRDSYNDFYLACPECDAPQIQGHYEDCAIGNALKE